MPTLADITVKKADGTTDVVYTAVSRAAGSVPALFRNNSVGTTLAERPTLLISSRDNGPRTARRINVEYSWPIISQDAGGNKSVAGRMTGSATCLVPSNQSTDVIAEQANQFANLLGSAMVKACFSEGYAPQ